ncbi:MAG: hypothetical protein IPJ58_11295 [Ardenticatenia bacterium]|nr:hypothetical protein [Ardenticatenia bacterium]
MGIRTIATVAPGHPEWNRSLSVRPATSHPGLKIKWGRVLLALVVLAGIVGTLVVLFAWPAIRTAMPVDQEAEACAGAPIEVRGIIGSEKKALLSDPVVVQRLRDSCGITVKFNTDGSLNMIDGDVAGQDFLWPGSTYLRDAFIARRPTGIKSEVIFNSPIVMIGWVRIADALAAAGIARKDADGVYRIDMQKFAEAIDKGTTWSDIGVAELGKRSIRAVPTDPTQSNSGNLFAGLLAVVFHADDIPAIGDVPTLLPQLQKYFQTVGYMERSSGDLFDLFRSSSWTAYPMIVGYESSLIEWSQESRANADWLRGQVAVIYPEPTVFSQHAFIALSPNGQRLMAGLQLPQIHSAAWERHGFHTGKVGLDNDLEVLTAIGGTDTVQTTPLPGREVMDAIVKAMR